MRYLLIRAANERAFSGYVTAETLKALYGAGWTAPELLAALIHLEKSNG